MKEGRRRPLDATHRPRGSGDTPSAVARDRVSSRQPEGRGSSFLLSSIAEELMAAYASYGDLRHLERRDLPSKQKVVALLNDLLTTLFPNWSENELLTETNLRHYLGSAMHSVYSRLEAEIAKSLKWARRRVAKGSDERLRARAQAIVEEVLAQLPKIKRRLARDIQAAYEGDPAAQSQEEIVLSYPCLYAIATYRIAHELYDRNVPIIPRMMSEHAHTLTGIDIHPGAKIGENFFIDHGTGVVIGETSEIGNNVRIYQGVTLGGKSLSHSEVAGLRGKKRHPTIEDDVVIYSGTTILGSTTVIGKGAVIGGNVWITSSIPPHTTVTIAPPKLRTLE
jgi:serine O-acetyltransferase